MELTKRQIDVLRIMAAQNEELVYEHGQGYVGNSPVSSRTVFALLRVCAIRHDPCSASPESGGLEIYTINEVGRKLAARPQNVSIRG